MHEQLAIENDTDLAWAAQVGLRRRHPAPVGRLAASCAESERALAELITPRLAAATSAGERAPEEDGDTEIRVRLLAAAVETALRVATQHWIDHPGSSLPQILRQVLTTADSHWS